MTGTWQCKRKTFAPRIFRQIQKYSKVTKPRRERCKEVFWYEMWCLKYFKMTWSCCILCLDILLGVFCVAFSCCCAVVLLPVSPTWSCFVALQHGAEHTKLLATLLMGDVATAQVEFGSFCSEREIVFCKRFCIRCISAFLVVRVFSLCLRSKLKMFFMMFFREIVRKSTLHWLTILLTTRKNHHLNVSMDTHIFCTTAGLGTRCQQPL